MTNNPQYHWAKLMHGFDRVELITFRSAGKTCIRTLWGQEDSEELSCAAEDLMLVALQEEHSFLYIKAGEIRLIKAWLPDGRFITDYQDFLSRLRLRLEIGEEPAEGNAYLSLFRNKMVNPERWNRQVLIRAWKESQGVGIGAGANKELVEVSTYERLLPAFDLNLEALIDANAKGTNNLLKAGKYLGRILRPFRYCTFHKPRIKQVDVDPDAYDGFSLVDRDYAARCGLETEMGDRVEVTVLTDRGLLKGHGEIRAMKEDVVVFGDQFKPQVKGDSFAGFERLKRSEEVYLDIQTIINLPQLWNHIPDWIDRMLTEVLIRVREGEMPSFMSRIDEDDFRQDGHLERERWVLKRLVQHQIPLVFPWMIRRVWNFYKAYLLRPAGLRVKIPGAIRVYLTPDIRTEQQSVNPGHCIIQGANLYISREDKAWLCTLLGGADFDDSVVCIPLQDNRLLIYRNPNQFGEWAVLKIQESDHVFKETHDLELPTSQRWNVWPEEGQSRAEAKQRIQAFWDDMHGKPVEACLLPRVPERVRDTVDVVRGPLTELFELAQAKIAEADEAIKLYCQQVAIPDLFMERSKLYPVAQALRTTYGQAVAALIRRSESISEPEAREEYFRRQIDKINARIRGALKRYTLDEQKLILRDLAHLCYLVLPGSGDGDYVLTQANDGVLGIPSSRGERNPGTAHIFIDLLLDLGLGVRIEKEAGVIYQTCQPRDIPEGNSMVITLVGGWRRLAERDGQSSVGIAEPVARQYIAEAYNKIRQMREITVSGKLITQDSAVIGYVSESKRIADGTYHIIHSVPAGKSILLHVSPSA